MLEYQTDSHSREFLIIKNTNYSQKIVSGSKRIKINTFFVILAYILANMKWFEDEFKIWEIWWTN